MTSSEKSYVYKCITYSTAVIASTASTVITSAPPSRIVCKHFSTDDSRTQSNSGLMSRENAACFRC